MSTKRLSRFANAPSLHQFIRKQQVLSLYRSLLLTARKIENPDVSKGILDQIKYEFRERQFTVDPAVIKTAIVEGNRNLQKIKSMFGTEKSSPHVEPSGTNADEVDMRVGQGWPWERNAK